MFSIECAPLSDFEEHAEIVEALNRANVAVSNDLPSRRPSYQFDYREVGVETVKRLFAYADIAVTNTPVGADGSFAPIASSGEWVVFPLEGLRSYLEASSPSGLRAYREFGSLDRIPDAMGSTLGVEDQLAMATLECLSFCETHQLLLAFSW